MMAGARVCSRVTSASIATGVASVLHPSRRGWTAITNALLLTSIPTDTGSIMTLLGVAPPGLMRVRALGPVNCSGSTTPNAEECPGCWAALSPGEQRATLPRGVLSDFEDIRRREVGVFL